MQTETIHTSTVAPAQQDDQAPARIPELNLAELHLVAGGAKGDKSGFIVTEGFIVNE